MTFECFACPSELIHNSIYPKTYDVRPDGGFFYRTSELDVRLVLETRLLLETLLVLKHIQLAILNLLLCVSLCTTLILPVYKHSTTFLF
jgi:hypothetical protein